MQWIHRVSKKSMLVCLLSCTFAFSQRASAQEQVSTLRLDGQAYVSYSETETAKLPSGSTIQFRFGLDTMAGHRGPAIRARISTR